MEGVSCGVRILCVDIEVPQRWKEKISRFPLTATRVKVTLTTPTPSVRYLASSNLA